MATLAIVFLVVLLLNLIPAFAPPTWMVMSWIGFNIDHGRPFAYAVVAASAATIGRLTLASMSRALVRGHLMRETDRQNIDVVAAWIGRHKISTASTFFAYSLSPFPSNYLFIAYGLSGLPLGTIGAAFFVGRTVSYTIWAHLGRLASAYFDSEPYQGGKYLSVYFVVTQLTLLGCVYAVAKVDWKLLIEAHKLSWRRPVKSPDKIEHGRIGR